MLRRRSGRLVRPVRVLKIAVPVEGRADQLAERVDASRRTREPEPESIPGLHVSQVATDGPVIGRPAVCDSVSEPIQLWVALQQPVGHSSLRRSRKWIKRTLPYAYPRGAF